MKFDYIFYHEIGNEYCCNDGSCISKLCKCGGVIHWEYNFLGCDCCGGWDSFECDICGDNYREC